MLLGVGGYDVASKNRGGNVVGVRLDGSAERFERLSGVTSWSDSRASRSRRLSSSAVVVCFADSRSTPFCFAICESSKSSRFSETNIEAHEVELLLKVHRIVLACVEQPTS